MTDGELARNRRKIIFGVDDNPANLGFLREILTGAGYTFKGFDNGAECLAAIWQDTPHLILLDIKMPGMDGFETCRRLRSLPQSHDIPVAFVTGCKTREDVRACLESGGNDFIIKPFDRARLLERALLWTGRRALPRSAN